MASVPLPLVEKNCGLELEEAVPALLARRLEHRSVVAVCLEWRRMGIARLLMSGVPSPLFDDLSRAARAFLYFLEGAEDAAKTTSRSEPFFDAVACGDDEAAVRIARASRPAWQDGKEYEEDFLYAWFLMKWFALKAPRPELEALLARWEQVLDGGDDPKLELCRALVDRDQQAFDSALDAIVSERRRATAKAMKDERLAPEDVPTTAKVWVELLGLLRMAEHAGLETPREVPLAPSVARRLDLASLPGPDAWRTVESHGELS